MEFRFREYRLPAPLKEAQEGLGEPPPAKRPRLDPPAINPPSSPDAPVDPRLSECLKKQVFPYVNSHIAALPDTVNKLKLGTQAIVLLAGSEFTEEYLTRNNGTISRRLEARLEAQSRALDYQLASSSNGVASSAPSRQPRVETPVPVPRLPYQVESKKRTPLPSAPSAPPRISSSPIPLPQIPIRTSPKKQVNGLGPGSRTSGTATRVNTSATKPEVIVIDDDDDDPVPEDVAVAKTTVARGRLGLSSAPLPNRVSEINPPKPTNPAKPVAYLPPALTVPATDLPEDPRTLAHTLIWRGQAQNPAEEKEGSTPSLSRWFTEKRRPYLTAEDRVALVNGAQSLLQLDPRDLTSPLTVHIDFTAEELDSLQILVRKTLKLSPDKKKKDAEKGLRAVLKKNSSFIPKVLDAVAQEKRLRRTRIDVKNLISDLMNHKTRPDPALFTLEKDEDDRRGDLLRSSRVHSLLLAREIVGHRGGGSMRCLQNFNNEFRKCREDDLAKRAEWTGCAGDISTITWVSNDGFICGTTEHSDSHNQQYNKPGNLVLGSCSGVTLRAYPEHRIVRPVVEKGENSTEAMRQSQDPWLYSSVVSSDYDAIHDRAFTCSFDRTVKIWEVEKSGASMRLLGEWGHDGNINFVAASKHKSGMVATAADVPWDAVRIYNVDHTNISSSPFRPHSCSRVRDEKGNEVLLDKWAYFPATMQWGLADDVKHLLLVGYSPRSRTGDDNDIPELRRDTGELCLWDGLTGEKWRITSATTQNVFEVLWHPTQPCFIAATSPVGLDLAPSVRTQVRIFRPADQDEFGVKAYSPIMTLDCTAIDINELTIMPNSFTYCYVTAGCTDGNTYVWDTARGDKPVHILRHGEPIDEYRGDREREDVGVKFTAWGTTPDRFYTASSDGVVKVWNVRSLERPLVRNLLEAPAPITAGMFCPDKSRLVVGDASGRVFMLSINDEKPQLQPPPTHHHRPFPPSMKNLPLPFRPPNPSSSKPRIIPHLLTRHPDPPPPTHDAAGRPIIAETGQALGHAYLVSGQLELHPIRTVGVVQGPRYAETGLWCREMHFNDDPGEPLFAGYASQQQEEQRRHKMGWRLDLGGVMKPVRDGGGVGGGGLGALHARNQAVDLEVERLMEEVRISLPGERINEVVEEDVVGGEEEGEDEWM